MAWLEEHRKSEILASRAEVASHRGEAAQAQLLYARAAVAEQHALAQVKPGQRRTYGIIAVSAASLLYKSGQYDQALDLAREIMTDERTPPFAHRQLDKLVGTIEEQPV